MIIERLNILLTRKLKEFYLCYQRKMHDVLVCKGELIYGNPKVLWIIYLKPEGGFALCIPNVAPGFLCLIIKFNYLSKTKPSISAFLR